MIDLFIKFFEYILKYLKKSKEKTIREISNTGPEITIVSKKSKVLIMVLWILSQWALLFLASIIFMESENNLHFLILLSVILLSICMIYTLYKTLNKKYLFMIHLPLIVGLFSIGMFFFDDFPSRYFSKHDIFSSALLIVFPLIYILKLGFKNINNRKIIDIIERLFYLYNLGYFFFIALNIIIISLWINISFFAPWTYIIIEILDQNYIHWFFEWIIYVWFLSIFLLFWVYVLHVYYDNYWQKRIHLNKWILIFLSVYLLSFTPNLLDIFYDYQIWKAESIIVEQWYNYDSDNAAKVLLLDRAFLSNIKQGNRINNDLFKKIYDTTPANYYGDRVAKYITNRSSFETNLSKVWDAADVILELAEIENRVIETSGTYKKTVLETTYMFHFENETITNQEVILNFESPSKYSVVSGLKLGLDLELIGQISPRWAARKVYENSLRRNTDPALIEKVWLNTYTLRVFPIPSKKVKQWKQLVEVTMLTPISGNDFIYSPKFSMTNLKFNEASNMLSKVYVKGQLVKEDIINNKELEKYISVDHLISASELNFDPNMNDEIMCLSSTLNDILTKNKIDITSKNELWSKINLFFDNSLSVERNSADYLYDEIYSWIKKYNWKLNDVDLYSYNFDVNKLASISDIKFWGYSEIDRVINYILNNKIQNERIIFVTDDDNFNFGVTQLRFDYIKKMTSNNISVIKIWKKIKTYKSDFNTLLASTNWNIYEVNSINDIAPTLSKIFEDSNIEYFKSCIIENRDIISSTGWIDINNIEDPLNDIVIDEKIEKIQAWIVGNLLFKSTINPDISHFVAFNQTILAKKYNIVNQYNSFIALENSSQQKELDSYNKQENKYDVKYKNYWWKEVTWFSWWGRWFSNESIQSNSLSNVSFGSVSDSSLRWSIQGSSFSSNRYSWSTSISIVWLFIFIIYLLEYIWFISFIIKYIRQK